MWLHQHLVPAGYLDSLLRLTLIQCPSEQDLYYDKLHWMMFLEEKTHMEFADNLILDLP